jgi:8-oxo-dGTP diphosphatase
MLVGASILIISSNASLLMQHRDNNPLINNPGKITLFGGSLEAGEAPIQAAVRELYEETGLVARPDELEPFGVYQKTQEVHGEDAMVHVFVLRDVDELRVRVYEGQGLYTVHPGDDLSIVNFSFVARQVVGDYFERLRA